MKAYVLQHVPFEGLGSMVEWLSEHKAEVEYIRFYQSWTLPDLGIDDLVISMGGPMSANDELACSWLKPEKKFIQEAVGRGLPVIGVCLGAQIIASALGARVFANPEKEIGWFPIESVDSKSDVFRFPRRATVFHWHGETFDLPQGAVHLARSRFCENQAFQFGQRVIGLQFHLEVTPEATNLMIENCRSDLVIGACIQSQ